MKLFLQLALKVKELLNLLILNDINLILKDQNYFSSHSNKHQKESNKDAKLDFEKNIFCNFSFKEVNIYSYMSEIVKINKTVCYLKDVFNINLLNKSIILKHVTWSKEVYDTTAVKRMNKHLINGFSMILQNIFYLIIMFKTFFTVIFIINLLVFNDYNFSNFNRDFNIKYKDINKISNSNKILDFINITVLDFDYIKELRIKNSENDIYSTIYNSQNRFDYLSKYSEVNVEFFMDSPNNSSIEDLKIFQTEKTKIKDYSINFKDYNNEINDMNSNNNTKYKDLQVKSYNYDKIEKEFQLLNIIESIYYIENDNIKTKKSNNFDIKNKTIIIKENYYIQQKPSITNSLNNNENNKNNNVVFNKPKYTSLYNPKFSDIIFYIIISILYLVKKHSNTSKAKNFQQLLAYYESYFVKQISKFSLSLSPNTSNNFCKIFIFLFINNFLLFSFQQAVFSVINLIFIIDELISNYSLFVKFFIMMFSSQLNFFFGFLFITLGFFMFPEKIILLCFVVLFTRLIKGEVLTIIQTKELIKKEMQKYQRNYASLLKLILTVKKVSILPATKLQFSQFLEENKSDNNNDSDSLILHESKTDVSSNYAKNKENYSDDDAIKERKQEIKDIFDNDNSYSIDNDASSCSSDIKIKKENNIYKSNNLNNSTNNNITSIVRNSNSTNFRVNADSSKGESITNIKSSDSSISWNPRKLFNFSYIFNKISSNTLTKINSISNLPNITTNLSSKNNLTLNPKLNQVNHELNISINNEINNKIYNQQHFFYYNKKINILERRVYHLNSNNYLSNIENWNNVLIFNRSFNSFPLNHSSKEAAWGSSLKSLTLDDYKGKSFKEIENYEEGKFQQIEITDFSVIVNTSLGFYNYILDKDILYEVSKITILTSNTNIKKQLEEKGIQFNKGNNDSDIIIRGENEDRENGISFIIPFLKNNFGLMFDEESNENQEDKQNTYHYIKVEDEVKTNDIIDINTKKINFDPNNFSINTANFNKIASCSNNNNINNNRKYTSNQTGSFPVVNTTINNSQLKTGNNGKDFVYSLKNNKLDIGSNTDKKIESKDINKNIFVFSNNNSSQDDIEIEDENLQKRMFSNKNSLKSSFNEEDSHRNLYKMSSFKVNKINNKKKDKDSFNNNINNNINKETNKDINDNTSNTAYNKFTTSNLNNELNQDFNTSIDSDYCRKINANNNNNANKEDKNNNNQIKKKLDTQVFYVFTNISQIASHHQLLVDKKYKNFLMSKISHEMKTPIITQNMLLEQLKNDCIMSLDVNEIIKSISRLCLINEQILNVVYEMNTLVSGFENLSFSLININVADIGKWGYNFLKLSLEGMCAKKIKPIFTVKDNDAASAIVESDMRNLKMMLIHIIRNAIKFVKNGKIEIVVEVIKEKVNKNTMKLNYENSNFSKNSRNSKVSKNNVKNQNSSIIINKVSDDKVTEAIETHKYESINKLVNYNKNLSNNANKLNNNPENISIFIDSNKSITKSKTSNNFEGKNNNEDNDDKTSIKENENKDEYKDYICLKIIDTGDGMSPEKLSHILSYMNGLTSLDSINKINPNTKTQTKKNNPFSSDDDTSGNNYSLPKAKLKVKYTQKNNFLYTRNSKKNVILKNKFQFIRTDSKFLTNQDQSTNKRILKSITLNNYKNNKKNNFNINNNGNSTTNINITNNSINTKMIRTPTTKFKINANLDNNFLNKLRSGSLENFNINYKDLFKQMNKHNIKSTMDLIKKNYKHCSEILSSDLDNFCKKGGLNLGLKLVKSICTKLGIEVILESKEKEGTCFTFKFPVKFYQKKEQLKRIRTEEPSKLMSKIKRNDASILSTNTFIEKSIYKKSDTTNENNRVKSKKSTYKSDNKLVSVNERNQRMKNNMDYRNLNVFNSNSYSPQLLDLKRNHTNNSVNANKDRIIAISEKLIKKNKDSINDHCDDIKKSDIVKGKKSIASTYRDLNKNNGKKSEDAGYNSSNSKNNNIDKQAIKEIKINTKKEEINHHLMNNIEVIKDMKDINNINNDKLCKEKILSYSDSSNNNNFLQNQNRNNIYNKNKEVRVKSSFCKMNSSNLESKNNINTKDNDNCNNYNKNNNASEQTSNNKYNSVSKNISNNHSSIDENVFKNIFAQFNNDFKNIESVANKEFTEKLKLINEIEERKKQFEQGCNQRQLNNESKNKNKDRYSIFKEVFRNINSNKCPKPSKKSILTFNSSSNNKIIFEEKDNAVMYNANTDNLQNVLANYAKTNLIKKESSNMTKFNMKNNHNKNKITSKYKDLALSNSIASVKHFKRDRNKLTSLLNDRDISILKEHKDKKYYSDNDELQIKSNFTPKYKLNEIALRDYSDSSGYSESFKIEDISERAYLESNIIKLKKNIKTSSQNYNKQVLPHSNSFLINKTLSKKSQTIDNYYYDINNNINIYQYNRDSYKNFKMSIKNHEEYGDGGSFKKTDNNEVTLDIFDRSGIKNDNTFMHLQSYQNLLANKFDDNQNNTINSPIVDQTRNNFSYLRLKKTKSFTTSNINDRIGGLSTLNKILNKSPSSYRSNIYNKVSFKSYDRKLTVELQSSNMKNPQHSQSKNNSIKESFSMNRSSNNNLSSQNNLDKSKKELKSESNASNQYLKRNSTLLNDKSINANRYLNKNIFNFANLTYNDAPTIILVDDDYFCRLSHKKLIKNVISELGIGPMNVMKACDGIDTLNIVLADQMNKRQICLIISDENMNYCNGSDSFILLTKMFRTDKLRKVPLWILTALEDDHELKNLKLRSGCDMILKKPPSMSTIRESFKQVFFNKNGEFIL